MIGAVVLIPALSHFLLPSGSQSPRTVGKPQTKVVLAA
jgi:hypothetical protein